MSAALAVPAIVTDAAEEHNAENLPVIESRDLAARHTENWHTHAQHSEPYSGR
jgi:hypothetical protein